MAAATVRIRGNATEAIAALEKLGITADATGKETEDKLGGAATKVGAMFARLGAQVERFGFEAGAALTEVGDHMAEAEAKGSGMSGKLAGIGKAALLGLTGATLVIGKLGIDAAIAAQKVDAQLKVAVDNTGASFEKLEPQIEATDGRMRQFGFTNEQTNSALTTLTRGLGSVSKAQGLMGVAADLARSKNIDLSDAATLVMKASEGQTRALKQLGLDLPVYAGGAQATYMANLSLEKAQRNLNFLLQKTPDAVNPASKAHISYEKALLTVQDAEIKLHRTQNSGKAIIEALTSRVHGAAKAYGDTFSGQVAIAKAQLDNLEETIGKKLLPILTGLMKGTEDVVNWFGKHKTAAIALAAVIGGSLAVVIGVTAINALTRFKASMIQAVQSIGFMRDSTVAMAATEEETAAVSEATGGGFGPIGIAIGAVALALVAFSGHWKQIWKGIENAGKMAWDFIDSALHNKVIQGILEVVAPITILFFHWKQVWEGIQTATSFAWNSVIKPVWSALQTAMQVTLINPLNAVKSAFSTVFGAVANIVATVWSKIEPILGKIGGALGKIGGFIKGAGHVAGNILSFGGVLADGGPARSGTPYLVGEAGPELFIPDSSGVVISHSQTAAMMHGGSGGSVAAFGGGNTALDRSSRIQDMIAAGSAVLRGAQFQLVGSGGGTLRAV